MYRKETIRNQISQQLNKKNVAILVLCVTLCFWVVVEINPFSRSSANYFEIAMHNCLQCKKEPFIARSGTNPEFIIRTASPKYDVHVSREIHRAGLWDVHILNSMRNAIQAGGGCIDSSTGLRRLVLDIGANMGYFGLYAASQGCDVFMAELQPKMIRYIQTSAYMNDFSFVKMSPDTRIISTPVSNPPTIFLHAGALGQKEGVIHLNIPTDSRNYGGFGINERSLTNSKESTEVKMQTLDNLLSGLVATVLFIKVDVEGFELQVIEGATEFFSGPSLIGTQMTMELGPLTQKRGIELLSKLGYMAKSNPTITQREDILFLKVA